MRMRCAADPIQAPSHATLGCVKVKRFQGHTSRIGNHRIRSCAGAFENLLIFQRAEGEPWPEVSPPPSSIPYRFTSLVTKSMVSDAPQEQGKDMHPPPTLPLARGGDWHGLHDVQARIAASVLLGPRAYSCSGNLHNLCQHGGLTGRFLPRKKGGADEDRRM
ncbi:hypothetical protein F5148DRAFT_12488 [Russula earlei]|uniref:Uncharacterized protein n=1 Tax=Russula earlei TaxID=71964 RepID=A0ACC0UPS2_9AGAM|nr:hypothetical protein F5148DRAFT_12488 [Russula earlei]